MALDQPNFASIIQNMILSSNPEATPDTIAQIQTFANDLAGHITDYIKTAEVTVPGSGLVAPSSGGPVTGSATGTIS